MEYLFLLSEKIVSSLKQKFSESKGTVDFFVFDNATINNTSFEIRFSHNTSSIYLSLSTHAHDMPWGIEVKVFICEIQKPTLNQWISNIKKGNSPVYEVYPNLLKDPLVKGEGLANEISSDLIEYLTTLKT